MARNVSTAETPAPLPGKQVIEEKKTITTDLPPGPAPAFARPGAMGPKPKNPSLNEWFGSMPPDERAHDYAYTLYRDDSRIIIVEENLDDRASGSMVYKFKEDEIKALDTAPFLQELMQWTKERYGGGAFHIMVNSRKHGRLMYNKGFKIEGTPIISNREAWQPGQQPGMAGMGGGGGDSTGVLPMLMKLIDDKLAAVTNKQQDPGAAVADVTRAIIDANSAAYKWAIDNAPKAADPTAQLMQMKAMFEMFKEMQPAAPQPVVAPAVIDPLDQFTKFAGVMKTLRDLDAPRENPQTMKDMIVEGIKTGLREMGGFKGGPRGTDWGTIADKILTPLIPLGIGLLGRFQAAAAARGPVIQPGQPQYPQFQPQPGAQAQQGYTPGVARSPGMAGAPPGSPVGGTFRPAAPPQPAPPTPPPPAAAQPAEQVVITEDVQGAVLWNHFTKRIVDLLTHNESGDVAAEALDKMFPDIAVHMNMMNEQALTAMISSDPELSKVKDDPRLPPFIKAFLGYFKDVDEPPEVGSAA